MLKDIWQKLIVPTILIIIFFISLATIKSELWSLIILVACIIITFTVKYQKKEWILLLVGTVLGIVLEVGGDLIYKLQYWNTESFLGVPLWLPLLWGFQFIIVYRLGAIIVKK
jgi:hypothetical protein